MKIENTEVLVPSGKALNDKDYMNSLLSSLKELVKNYAVVLTETSNEILYKKYKELADKEENVIFGGRLGEYKYYDMDAVIASALERCEIEL